MGIQGPPGDKGPIGPAGPAGKDAIVDYSKITSDSTLKDSIKNLLLSDSSFNAMVTKFLNDNASKFQGPPGKTTFSLLSSSEKAEIIASLLSGINLDTLISGIVDNDSLKNTITAFIKDNSSLFVPKSGIFSSSDPKFQEWLKEYNGSTLYCANGSCIVPTTGTATAKSIDSNWRIVADEQAFRFRHNIDNPGVDKAVIFKDGHVHAKNGIRVYPGIWGDGEVKINEPLRIGDWKMYQASNGNLHIENNNGKAFSMQANDGNIATYNGSDWKKLLRSNGEIRIRDRQDDAYLWASSSNWGVHRWDWRNLDGNDNRGKWYVEY